MFLTEGIEMFFVGDAGGRVDGHATGRAKDFANTDRYPPLSPLPPAFHGLIPGQ